MKNVEKHIDDIVSRVLSEAINSKADDILTLATESLHGGQKKIDVAEPKGKITSADFKKLRDKKEKPKTPAGFEHGEIVSGEIWEKDGMKKVMDRDGTQQINYQRTNLYIEALDLLKKI